MVYNRGQLYMFRGSVRTMDTLFSSWVVVCVCLTLVAVGSVVYLRSRAGSPTPDRAPRETPMVALVRRRRELSAQLLDLAGDGGTDLLQAEARRQRASAVSIEVLEAAVARAERNSANAELSPDRMAALSAGGRR